MKYLFIGGSRDGELHAVRTSSERFVYMPSSKLQPANDGLAADTTTPFEVEEYRMLSIHGECTEFVVFTIASMSPDEAINTLIRNYKPA